MKTIKMTLIINSFRRLISVSVLSLFVIASIFATPESRSITDSDNKNLSVKVYPNINVLYGFSDIHPTSTGTGFLNPFPSGTLEMDSTNQKMEGVFYLYHITNSKLYTITLFASPMKSNKSSELLGYDILIDNTYPAFTKSTTDSGNAWVEGVPGVAGEYAIARNINNYDTVLLSHETKKNNIWYRTLNISVPVSKILEKGGVGETWTGSIRAVFTENK